jgi:hypothetical protein
MLKILNCMGWTKVNTGGEYPKKISRQETGIFEKKYIYIYIYIYIYSYAWKGYRVTGRHRTRNKYPCLLLNLEMGFKHK